MDVLPLAVTTVPDASLLRLHGARHAVEVHILGEADVGDAGGFLADQVDVRVEQDGVYGLLRFGQSCGAGDNTGHGLMRLTNTISQNICCDLSVDLL